MTKTIKLTDAQAATLMRGVQQANGFISPAPKTPAPMAVQAAQKLSALGMVEQMPCFHDEPWYFRDDETGECVGFRVTALALETLAIDSSEWPAYATQGAQADAPAPVADMPAEWQAPGPTEQDLDIADAAGERAAYEAEQAAELAAEEAADEPLASVAELSAAMVAAGTVQAGQLVVLTTGTGGSQLAEPLASESNALAAEIQRGFDAAASGAPKPSLRDAAAAFLAAWDAGPLKAPTNSELTAAVERLRAAMPTAKAPKVAGEVSAPREGSKLALVINLLSRAGGAMAAEVEDATGWNNTSTRGFISGLKIKRGLAVDSRKEGRATRYWIGAENAPTTPAPARAVAPKAAKGEQAAF